MEKPMKKRNKILAFLPKAASSPVTFQVSPPISPSGKGFSGPIVSLIPREARRKSENGSFDAREPASPKVSCIGQIKSKKKNKQTLNKPKPASPPSQAFPEEKTKRKPFVMLKVLKGSKRGHKSDVSDAEAVAERAPSLQQMKQFSSARGMLSDFDWRAYDAARGAGCASNPLYEENGAKSEKEEKLVVNRVGIVEETRKENLWERRTTSSLTPVSVVTP